MEVRVRVEQTLTYYEQALKKTQAPLKPDRAGRIIWGQRSLDVGLLGLFVGRQIGLRGLAPPGPGF